MKLSILSFALLIGAASAVSDHVPHVHNGAPSLAKRTPAAKKLELKKCRPVTSKSSSTTTTQSTTASTTPSTTSSTTTTSSALATCTPGDPNLSPYRCTGGSICGATPDCYIVADVDACNVLQAGNPHYAASSYDLSTGDCNLYIACCQQR